ncbi:hypothetical protein RDV89_19135 [Nocardioides zeae]|uniref:Lipoprotein n=1 Tax=Nocardioides imazamoxiresistens TaxID=3231893 RepID=A0ABU3Q151_9ACTN|nr:hypothetical protein [Nocardioides zeae]MDT9595210.1 hypothetical protein [Nocardioides zeae]
MPRPLLALVLAAAATLTACGAAHGPPACGSVWVVGGTLPADYAMCQRSGPHDSLTVSRVLECGDGRRLVSYLGEDPRLWAFAGGTIATASPEYADAYEECTGLDWSRRPGR